MKTVVVGSGITGITTAYYLAKAGHNVVVLDQESYAGMRCSYSNGGQISVCNSDVWNTWQNVVKGFKWMLKRDAPLLIRPSLHIDKIIWLTKFLYNTAKNVYEQNTLKTIEMGLLARKLYQEIISEEQLEFDQRYSGILHIYKNQKYFDQAVNSIKLYNEHGCRREVYTLAQIKSLDSATSYMNNLIGGIFTMDDFTGDCHKFCYELRRILSLKYNVNFSFNENIISIQDLVGYDNIIICAGTGSVKLADSIGETLDIYPVKGYSITIHGNTESILPKVSLLDDEAKIVTSTLGNRLRVAGTAELNGINYDIRRDRIEPLLRWVHKNLPMVNTHDYNSYACLRPMTPDMLPITKRSDTQENVYYNTGHGHLGWTLAPYTAKYIVEQIGEVNGTN